MPSDKGNSTPDADGARSLALQALIGAGSDPLLHSFPYGVVVAFDEDLRFLSAGGVGLTDVGLSRARLEGRTIFEVFSPEVVAVIEPLYRRALAGEPSTLDLPFEGRVYLQRVGPLRDAVGQIVAGMGLTEDVTERRAQEQALTDERRRLREAQAIGHVGSWEWDVATEVVTWSDTLFEIYGLDPGDFAGDYEAARSCIHPDDRYKMDEATDNCLATGAPMRFRHRVIRANDHETRWVHARGEAVYENGQIVRLAGAIADVTDLVQAEARAEAARDVAMEASRQKSVFLATMSHEIRTPMNAVIGMTGLLLDTTLDAEQRDLADTVKAGGDALLKIIDDILDFSRIEAGGLQLEHAPFSLRDCVNGALDLVAATAAAKGLEVFGQVGVGCPSEVVGDAKRLGQVLVNLLGNAVKFTAHGQVRLIVELEAAVELDAVEVEAAFGLEAAIELEAADTDKVCLRISVSDTGIGVASDRLASLFDSFSQVDESTTRPYGGVGLGLTITQRLVAAMGGTMTVESVVGVGSTFSLSVLLGRAAFLDQATDSKASARLQRNAALVPRPKLFAARPVQRSELSGRAPAEAAPRAASMRVLLAEDNAVNQRMGRIMLEKLGHLVDVVGNGQEAAEAVLTVPYDVVFMDVEMPLMDGLEGTRVIRRRVAADWQPQIVALTAGALDEQRQACLDAGMDDFLTKPVRLADLDTALDNMALRVRERQFAEAPGATDEPW
jgi:PAS domain S-box-containing protein